MRRRNSVTEQSPSGEAHGFVVFYIISLSVDLRQAPTCDMERQTDFDGFIDEIRTSNASPCIVHAWPDCGHQSSSSTVEHHVQWWIKQPMESGTRTVCRQCHEDAITSFYVLEHTRRWKVRCQRPIRATDSTHYYPSRYCTTLHTVAISLCSKLDQGHFSSQRTGTVPPLSGASVPE